MDHYYKVADRRLFYKVYRTTSCGCSFMIGRFSDICPCFGSKIVSPIWTKCLPVLKCLQLVRHSSFFFHANRNLDSFIIWFRRFIACFAIKLLVFGIATLVHFWLICPLGRDLMWNLPNDLAHLENYRPIILLSQIY